MTNVLNNKTITQRPVLQMKSFIKNGLIFFEVVHDSSYQYRIGSILCSSHLYRLISKYALEFVKN